MQNDRKEPVLLSACHIMELGRNLDAGKGGGGSSVDQTQRWSTYQNVLLEEFSGLSCQTLWRKASLGGSRVEICFLTDEPFYVPVGRSSHVKAEMTVGWRVCHCFHLQIGHLHIEMRGCETLTPPPHLVLLRVCPAYTLSASNCLQQQQLWLGTRALSAVIF